jgi:prefoldin subunit 5
MTTGLNSQQEQELRAQVEQVRERLEHHAAELRVVDAEIETLAPQRTHHDLLEQACGSLEKLGELGVGSLFWGERIESARVAEQLRAVRSRITAFQAQLGELEARRRTVLAGVGREEEDLEFLAEDLYQAREAEERRKLEWIVEREISPAATRVQVMAWARGGDDDRLFRKALAASMAASLLLMAVLPLVDLPLPARFSPDSTVSKRLAQLVRQEQAKPVPPPPVLADARPEEERRPDPQGREPERPQKPLLPEPQTLAAADPAPAIPGLAGPETPAAGAPGPPQQKVAQAGILAFRDKFASLARDRVAPRLGADARFIDSGDVSQSQASSRSMLTTNAPGSSGGINLSSLSRSVGGGGGGGGGGGQGAGGGGGGGGLDGVQVGRATSSIAGIGGDDRPKARGGPGAARTDEEIQIVFDRYKASFYRLYNRELRNDPTLRGQMVLRLTIEPDGSVSMCTLQSSDMNAPALADQVVSRTMTINFGAKDVQAVTIVYPIDFLPAT